ncbi:MAG: polysaccharide deacetylase family protein [Candidatus Pacearchaeota archaeon]|nr:polysaccharide deacetylase family protein [Candidatus Pacearchaeota archaeon]
MKQVLLTFDIEEFDSLFDFDYPSEEEDIFKISKNGLDKIAKLLEKNEIKATFFTTAKFAKKYPKLIREISKKHEIACHGYSHSDNYKKDISKIDLAKKEIEKIIKKNINGFRAPRFEIKDISSLSDIGFSYDSSIHPTFIPGRYMHLFKKRKVHKIGEIIEIPLSVFPLVRLPIFWLAFKNLPLLYSKLFAKINFLSSDYLMLIFHSWEFDNLSKIKIPKYMKKKSGDEFLKMLEEYIIYLKSIGCTFSTISGYLQKSLR